jgi:anaerobic selenocysteine-containing dehydrogenase
MHSPEFNTPSAKAHFITHAIPVVNPHAEDFPLLLASVRSEGQFNSIIYEETDSYRFQASRNTVFLAFADMQNLSVKNGDKVNVVSAQGTMHGAVVQRFDLPEGNAMAYYPEANVLAEHKLDPRSLTPNFKSIAVRIEIPE